MTSMDCPLTITSTSESSESSKCNSNCNQRLDASIIPKSCFHNNNNKSKKKVKFVEYITVTECLHFLDYSKKEFKGTWYSEKEMRESRDEYRSLLEQQQQLTQQQQQEQFCLRGLEYKTPMGNKRREQNKRVAWQAVEREQYRQWDQGFKDATRLAEEYKIATQHCVQKAILQAKEDRQAVLQMDNTSSSSSSSSPTSFTATKMHTAMATAASGAAAAARRPMRSHGRVSRAA